MLILASKSPRRVALLKEMGLSFTCHPANIDENISSIPLLSVPTFLAEAKAAAVAYLYPESLILGADTMISVDKKIIGKPKNLEYAKRILLELSGKKHRVITGVCLMRKLDHVRCVFEDTSVVWFKKIDKKIVQEYFSHVDPMDKAGAYAIQEHGEMIIEKVEGSINNIIGLPTEKLSKTLQTVKGEI